MKRVLALVLAVIMMAGMLSSCGSDDPVVLFFAVKDKAGTFDPQIVSNTTSSIVVRNCFEGLLRKDENGDIINGVAKSWDVSPDGLTYTFHLRTDAVWHFTSNAEKQLEGKLPENFDLSVTAEDFRFALLRAVDPITAAPLSYMLYNIENAPEILAGNMDREELGVEAVDRHTLRITLSQPQSNFPEVLTEPVCMPCNRTFFEACSGRYGTLIAFSLSNGPFYLSRFNEDSCRINKAADYVGESTARPDYVWLYVTEDEETLLEVLETDDYSGAVISEDTYNALKVKKSMTVTETPNILRSLILNLRDDVLSNENIRKAITAATDIDLIAGNEGRTPAKGLVPLSAAPENAAEAPSVFDEKAAAEYLKTGLEELKKTSIDISILCEQRYGDSMRRLMQEWQRILGIYVNFSVKTATAAEIKAAVNSGNYQIAFYQRAAETDNIYEYFGSFISDSNIIIAPEEIPEEETTEEIITESLLPDEGNTDEAYTGLSPENMPATPENTPESPEVIPEEPSFPAAAPEEPDTEEAEAPEETRSSEDTPQPDQMGAVNFARPQVSTLAFSRNVNALPVAKSSFAASEDASALIKLIAGLYSGNDDNFKENYKAIENNIMEHNVFIPVWYENSYLVCTKDVTGVIFFSGSDKLYFHNATNVKE